MVGLAISIVSLLPSRWSFEIAKERTAQRHGHACAGGGEHGEKSIETIRRAETAVSSTRWSGEEIGIGCSQVAALR